MDYILIGVMLLFCFFSYLHGDIFHTGGSSFAYLNGHFWDFYDYNKKYLNVNNYLPTTYVFFALWNIPIRMLGLVTYPTRKVAVGVALWYKLLTIVFFIGTAYYIYKICCELELNKKTAKIAALIFLTNPIAIYSQFIFCQYDIITTFFLVVGFYYWVKECDYKFIGAFAIALTCKYFSLLFFLPLLLIKEKNILKIVYKVLLVCSLFIVETLIYIHSSAFIDGVFGFNAISYIFNLSLDLGYVKISVVILLFALLCGYCYFSEKDNYNELAISTLNFVTFIAFGLSFWHPQWLLIAVPFWTLGTVFSKNKELYLLLDIFLMIFYIGFAIKSFGAGVSEGLLKNLAWKWILGDVSRISGNFTMSSFILGIDKNFLFSCFASILAVYVFFKTPSFFNKGTDVNLEAPSIAWLMRARWMVVLVIFIIPSLITLYINYSEPSDILGFSNKNIKYIGGMCDGVYYDQKIVLDDAYDVSSISIYTGTYDRENDCTLICELFDCDDEKLLSKEIDAKKLANNSYTKISFDDIRIEPGEYTIRFYCKGVLGDLSNTISLAMADSPKDGKVYAIIGGERQKYNLVLTLNGESVDD
ncbi:hypothetical protein CSX00_06365 [Pseudobutyrivibrio ruminis]|uniref:Uncharacterized protein n=2 Tax=Pseudobutyrivibrio ruminis TaxID=46206 RepID=A0A2G3EAN7_9FIRM|nr:hypothetical protein CSX00_06365 [Pseudobutyrivibrio ruminis]